MAGAVPEPPEPQPASRRSRRTEGPEMPRVVKVVRTLSRRTAGDGRAGMTTVNFHIAAMILPCLSCSMARKRSAGAGGHEANQLPADSCQQEARAEHRELQ